MAHGSYTAVPKLTNSHAPGFGCTLLGRRKLVAAKAPNTDGLRDSDGEMKRLRVVLMADCWVADVEEKAACIAAMQENDIEPVLRNADGWALGDSCNTWPPASFDATAIARFQAKKRRKEEGAAVNGTSVAAG